MVRTEVLRQVGPFDPVFGSYYEDYEVKLGENEDQIALQSVIKDINVKQDFTLFANTKHTLKFGVNAIHHTIEPGNVNAGSNTGINKNPPFFVSLHYIKYLT